MCLISRAGEQVVGVFPRAEAGRVEDGRESGQLSVRAVSHPRSSNRTCPFRASGFPTGFIVDSRTRAHRPLQAHYAQRAEHPFLRELAGALRRHLVAPPQKVPHFVIDILVDCPISLRRAPAAEVGSPALQLLIQPLAHFRPRSSHCSAPAGLPPVSLILATLFFDGLYPIYS